MRIWMEKTSHHSASLGASPTQKTEPWGLESERLLSATSKRSLNSAHSKSNLHHSCGNIFVHKMWTFQQCGVVVKLGHQNLPNHSPFFIGSPFLKLLFCIILKWPPEILMWHRKIVVSQLSTPPTFRVPACHLGTCSSFFARSRQRPTFSMSCHEVFGCRGANSLALCGSSASCWRRAKDIKDSLEDMF